MPKHTRQNHGSISSQTGANSKVPTSRLQAQSNSFKSKGRNSVKKNKGRGKEVATPDHIH